MIRHHDDQISENDLYFGEDEGCEPRCDECGCDLFTEPHEEDCSGYWTEDDDDDDCD